MAPFKSFQNTPTYKSLGNLSFPKSLFGLNSVQPTATTSNLSATAPFFPTPTGAPIPPAKQTFVNNAASGSALGTTGKGAGLGLTGSQFQGPTPQPQPSPTPEQAPPPDPFSAYRGFLSDYSKSLTSNPDTEKAALVSAGLAGDFDTRSLEARRAYEEALDTPGMLKAGAQEAASLSRRRSDSNLADLAVQGSAADRRLMALQGGDTARQNFLKQRADLSQPMKLGDKYFDPSTGQEIKGLKDIAPPEDFTLSEGQQRYRINAKTGQYEKIASVGKTYAPGTGSGSGAYVAGANTTVDSWANRIQSGQNKITDIPASQAGLRNQVAVALDAMGNSLDGKPTTTELGKSALVTANDLMTKFTEGRGTSVVGGSRVFGGFLAGMTPGSDAANFKNDFNSLKSQLSLEGVKYLKGQGQVSDAERALLAQAVTKLNLSQSDGEFKKTLGTIITKLTGGGIIGTEGSSDDAELRAAGYTDEQIAEIKTAQ